MNPLWHFGNRLLDPQINAGNDIRPWRWKGYTGYHIGPVTVGRRDDSAILQLSGELANENFSAAWALADHCTRIDLAVTVWGGDEYGNLATRHANEIGHWKEGHQGCPKTKLILDDGEPSTLYVGARESDLFARIYDKGLESGDPRFKGAWRYELEIKGDPAQRSAAYLHSAADKSSWCRNAVQQYFARRGIRPIFCSVGAKVSICTLRPVTDNSSRLAWLQSQVRPAVQKLLAAGEGEAVMEALGIPKSLMERWRLRWLEQSHQDDLLGDEDGEQTDA